MIKTALITGHGGFVGRHMHDRFVELGWNVHGVDVAYPWMYDFNNYIRDTAEYTRQFDLVVHCAYHVGGRAGIDGNNRNFIKNLQLDANLFDWALKTGQKAVMYFSSSAAYPACYQCDNQGCYGKHWEGSWHPHMILNEDYIDLDNELPSEPFDNYGWVKLTGERLAREAANNGLRVHVLRPFSGCGPDQSLDYPWPAIAKRAKDGDFTVWGSNGQCRDWIDISDIIEGALAVYEADERRPTNLCSGVATEMGELMMKFAKRFHGLTPEVQYLSDKPTGPHYRVGDPSRMLEHYAPKKDLEQMIDETVLYLS